MLAVLEALRKYKLTRTTPIYVKKLTLIFKNN